MSKTLYGIAALLGVLLLVLVAVELMPEAYYGDSWKAPVVAAEEPAMTAKELCQANTIIVGSLQACHKHSTCSLGDAEVIDMYLAGKAAVIECKKAQMIDMFVEYEIQIQKLEDDTADSFPEEETDPEHETWCPQEDAEGHIRA